MNAKSNEGGLVMSNRVWRIIGVLMFYITALALAACSGESAGDPGKYEYTFEDGDEGWVHDFADLPCLKESMGTVTTCRGIITVTTCLCSSRLKPAD
jgi:hypothetical protein